MEEIKRKRNRSLKIVVLSFLIVGLFFSYVLRDKITKIQDQELKIKVQQSQLDASNNIINEGINLEKDNLTRLNTQIKEYQNLLEAYDIQDKDLEEKDSIIQILQSEISFLLDTREEINKARQKITNLKDISKRYIYQVDSLLKMNQNLKEKNRSQKNELDKKDQELDKKDQELDKKDKTIYMQDSVLTKVAVLKIKSDDIETKSFKYGKGMQEKPTLRSGSISLLITTCKVSKNPIVENGAKLVYLQYIDPNDDLILAKDTSNRPFFYSKDSVVFATMFKKIEYSNQEESLTFRWEREDPLQKGKYITRFYIVDTNRIGRDEIAGESTFELD